MRRARHAGLRTHPIGNHAREQLPAVADVGPVEPVSHVWKSASADHPAGKELPCQIGGNPRAADAALRTLVDKDSDTSAYQIAEVYALRNDPQATFEWLDRASSNRDAGIRYLLYDPFILRYKHDPRFAAFCHEVGLPVPR